MKIPDPPEGSKGKDCGYGTRAPPSASSPRRQALEPKRSSRTLRYGIWRVSVIEVCALLAALLDAAAYGDAPMQLHRTTCMARLSSACGVECTTLRRLAAHTRAQHTSCDRRSRCGTVQRCGVHGRTVRLGRCCRVLSGGQNVAKTRVDICRVFSSHVQTLQCVSLCTVHCRQLSPVAVYSCAVSRSCCGSRWFFVGSLSQCLRHKYAHNLSARQRSYR